LWVIVVEDVLRSLAEYGGCVESLKSDPVIGPHLDRLVGTDMSAMRLEARNVVSSLIYAMLDDEGNLAFSDERFDREWRKVADFFGTNQIKYKTVAPLPNLTIANFPLRLNEELVLDRLTQDEVTRCHSVGVLRPLSLRFPLIDASVAVGVRKTTKRPKTIRMGDEPPNKEMDWPRAPLEIARP
jgi:hypothetical protein